MVGFVGFIGFFPDKFGTKTLPLALQSSPMSKARKKSRPRRRGARRKSENDFGLEAHTRRQVKAVITIGLGLVLFLAIKGNAGALGLAISRILTFMFGTWNVLFPGVLIVLGCLLMIGTAPKNPAACSTVILRTSLMFLPLY